MQFLYVLLDNGAVGIRLCKYDLLHHSNMEHTTHTRVLIDTNTYRREEKTVNGPGW